MKSLYKNSIQIHHMLRTSDTTKKNISKFLSAFCPKLWSKSDYFLFCIDQLINSCKMKARQSSNLRSCYGPWSPSSNCPDARCECCTDQVCKLYKCTIYSKIKLIHPKQSCPIRIIRDHTYTCIYMYVSYGYLHW